MNIIPSSRFILNSASSSIKLLMLRPEIWALLKSCKIDGCKTEQSICRLCKHRNNYKYCTTRFKRCDILCDKLRSTNHQQNIDPYLNSWNIHIITVIHTILQTLTTSDTISRQCSLKVHFVTKMDHILLFYIYRIHIIIYLSNVQSLKGL